MVQNPAPALRHPRSMPHEGEGALTHTDNTHTHILTHDLEIVLLASPSMYNFGILVDRFTAEKGVSGAITPRNFLKSVHVVWPILGISQSLINRIIIHFNFE